MSNEAPNCARCPYKPSERLCRNEDGKFPGFCPTRNMSELVEQSLKEYKNNLGICEFARQATIQEGDGYSNKGHGYEEIRGSKTRIEEIMGFAKKLNYKRLGLAFCVGLRKEAKIVEDIFSSGGFDVVSAVCNVGGISKERIGVNKDQQINPDAREAMCNPILQAMILNKEQTDLNVLLGLCVGHDSLFFKYADAPCTVLAVKDRVLGHNPLAAVYNADSYYRNLK
ncbi:DUF1847 domain-containing protein [candidate division KSB1 bacterium]|nr:DUF1847 domain-containing protein [candidate division KSB1 bacterium]